MHLMSPSPAQQRPSRAKRASQCSRHHVPPHLVELRAAACGRAPGTLRALAPAAKLRNTGELLRAHAAPVQTTSITTTTVHDPSAGREPTAEPSADSDTICWTSYWWPVQAIENLNPKVPTHVDLLGKSMVVWGDSKGNWHCMEDKCPHRLAPLSEGRVEKDNIMCCYHGWTFSGDGSCTSIPQLASDPKAHDNACCSKRSCVTSYPTRVENGLLWVWPEAGLEAAAKAAATSPTSTVWQGMNPYYVRDIPVRYDVVVENFLDPSHAPYAHHGVIGNRYKPVSAWGSMVVSDVAKDGMLATSKFFGRPLYLQFQPPFRIKYYSDPSNPSIQLSVVPTKPGWTRVFLNTPRHPPFLRTLPLPVQWWLKFRLSITALDHVRTRNAIFDGDNYMLHQAERLLPTSNGIGTEVTRAYYMPAGDDGMVVALRKWFQQFGGDVPMCSAADEAAMPPSVTKEQAIDRWNQHTKQCSHCLKALAIIEKVQAMNVAVGLTAAVAFIGQAVTAAALAHSPWLVNAATAAAAATTATHSTAPLWAGSAGTAISSWWHASHVAGLQGGILVAGVMAALCLLVHHTLNTIRQKFLYEEYVHAVRD